MINVSKMLIATMKKSVLFIAIIAQLVMTGCAHVEPWERGNLARPDMAFDAFPAQTFFRNHIYGSRETAPPLGSGGSGGGCGCY